MKRFGYQEPAIEFLKKTPKAILALKMRMGKSRCALMAAGKGPVLVVCPPNAQINWGRQIDEWRPDLTWQTLSSKKTKVDMSVDVHIVPYSLIDYFTDNKLLRRPAYFILDEFHYCKTLGAKRSKASMKHLKSAPRAVCLSGTPMPNRPMEWYPVLKALGIAHNKAKFGLKYCAGWKSPWGWDYTGHSNLDDLRKILKPIMFYRSMDDLAKYLPPVLPPVLIDLDLPVDRREKEFTIKNVEQPLRSVSFEAMSDIMHLTATERKAKPALEHIEDVLESEDKVIVWVYHRDLAEFLRDKLAGYNPLLIYGGSKRAQDTIDLFHKPKHRVLIANYMSVGEAVEITAASYNIFVEAPWNPGKLEQAIMRCWGPKQPEPVRTDILTINRSIDSIVLRHILQKMKIIDKLMKETFIMERTDEVIADLIKARCVENDMLPSEYMAELMPDVFSDGDDEGDEEETPAPKKKGKKKVAKKAAAKAKVIEEDVFEDEDEDEDEQEEIPDVDTVRKALAKVMRDKGADQVRAILAKFKAKNISALKEKNYGDVVAAAEEALDE